jgi:hypothetical protein
MCCVTDSTEAKSKQNCSPGSSEMLLRHDYIFGPDNLPLLYSLASDFDLLVCPHSRYGDVLYACTHARATPMENSHRTYIRLHTITLAHTHSAHDFLPLACVWVCGCVGAHPRTHPRAYTRMHARSVRACVRAHAYTCAYALCRALHRVICATKDLPMHLRSG